MSARLNSSIKWLRISLSLMGATLVLLLALPFAVPLEHYIPELQTLASEQLHEPVVIGGINIQLLPLPSVVLHQVRVGAQPDATIDSISARIDPYSLFKSLKVLTHVDLTGVRLRPKGLEKLPLWLKLESPQQVDLRLVRIHRSYLVLPNLTLGPLLSLIAGILILVVPRLLNYIVAIYLIVVGLVGLFGGANFRMH